MLPEAIWFVTFLSSLSDGKTACAAIGGLLKEVQKWNVVRCVAVCCTGDKCNTQNPTLPYPGSGGDFEFNVMFNTATECVIRGLVNFILFIDFFSI